MQTNAFGLYLIAVTPFVFTLHSVEALKMGA